MIGFLRQMAQYGDDAVKFAKSLLDDGATVTAARQATIRKFGGSGGKTPSRFPAGRPQLKATRPSMAAATKVVKPRAKPGGVNKGADAPKLSKPTGGKGRATVKAQTPSVRASRPNLQATRPALAASTKVVKPRAKPGGVNKGASPKGGVTITRTKIKPPAPKPKPKSTTGRKIAKGAGAAAATLAVTKMIQDAMKRREALANMPLPKSKPAKPKGRAKPGGTGKGQDPKKAPPRAGSGPATRGSAKRGATKTITAGKGVGFGPKGNIFPSSPAERAALMKMYGGTGSAAAKAAKAGKQGNLEAGRKAYEAAKKKRLSTVKKSSGKKVVPPKYKGFSKLPEKVQKKMDPAAAKKYKYGKKVASYKKGKSVGSGVVARQVKGFGAARRPKK